MEQTYEVGRHVFGVRTNSEPFAAWLDETFSAFRSSEKLGAMYSILVADEAEGRPGKRFHAVYRQSTVLARTLDLGEVVRALRADFESYFFTDWDEGVYVDLAPVSTNGTVALVPRLGLPLLGGIHRAVERAGISVPVGERIAIDPDSGDLVPPPRLSLPDDALAELARLVPGNDVTPEDDASGEAPVARPSALCLIAPARGQQVRPVSRAYAIKRLANDDVVNLEKLGVRALEGLARFTEGVPCFDLEYSSADDLLEGLVTALHPQPARAAALPPA